MKKLVNQGLILLLIILGIYYLSYRHTSPIFNEFNYFNPENIVTRSYFWEPTFKNAVTKISTHIVVGSVLDIPEESIGMFRVEVTENLLSDVKEDIIYLYATNNLFRKNEDYLFMLNKMSSTVYPHDFYVPLEEFVFSVDAARDRIKRLENPSQQKYIVPFQEEKYNSFTEIKKYIKNLKSKNINLYKNDTEIVIQAKNDEDLIKMADYILLIQPASITPNSNNMIMITRFVELETFKGKLEDTRILLLPTGIKLDEKYLVFLIDHRESVTLATRHGSIISEKDERFKELIEKLSQ
ncbi:hypothetical protein [Alkaliphilus transvaalensis]|uniref:hypothetical protein n=1 Tax=Alkaliphilus transvaalensis TaxID=114628 RepID=UPI00047E859B|nr:hypothetical protein [Alkaliphilus transvaalensis]